MTYKEPYKDYIVMTAKPRNDVKLSTKKFKNTNEVQSLPYVIARSETTWQSTNAKVERKFWKGVKKEKNVV